MALVVFCATTASLVPSSAFTANLHIDTGNRITTDPLRHTAEVVSGRFVPSTTARRELQALEFIGSRSDLFGLLDPTGELCLEREESDNLVMAHLRFTQTFEGLRVWGCQKVVHFDTDGSIYLVAGQHIRTPSIATRPAISVSSAEGAAYKDIEPSIGSRAVRSETELLIYPNEGIPQLAWLITFYGVDIGGIRYRVFVDAQTGKILHKFNDIHFDGPAVGAGTDVSGVLRTLQTYQFGSDYKLIDATHPMYQPPIDNLRGVIETYWNKHRFGGIVTDTAGDNVFDNSPEYQTAVSAHYFAQRFYDYFLTTFGRHGLSNSGSTIITNVHDSAYANNAYWDGTSVSFSDGDGIDWRPFSGDLDLVGHELTHGVTEFTAGLIYEFESGALNESMSDFFGNMIERTDWLIGDDIRITAPGFIRSLADPHQGLIPNQFPFGYQPATLQEFVDTILWFDNGGVHTNSGIPNHVGYLMSQTMGRDKAEQIWYRTLTVYLTPSSSFQFWSIMLTQAAQDLYGAGSPEQDETEAALDSAGFGLIEVTPPSIPSMVVALGKTTSTTIKLTNHRIEPVTITAATAVNGSVAVHGPLPAIIGVGDSLTYTITADATAATECDLGVLSDTVVFTSPMLRIPQILVPLTRTTAYADVVPQVTEIHTKCLTVEVWNDPGVQSFAIPGMNMLKTGSLLIGQVKGTDTAMYWHLYGSSTYTVIDTFSRSLAPNGDSLLSFRFISSDGDIHGKVQYRFKTLNTEGCQILIADYWLTNPCRPSRIITAGTYFDWDADVPTNNTSFPYCHYPNESTVRCVYYIQADYLALACGELNRTSYYSNPVACAIDVGSFLRSEFTPGGVYRRLVSPYSCWGIDHTDYALLEGFGNRTLGPGDTAEFSMAYMFNIGDLSGFVPLINSIPPMCCTDFTGNVDCSYDGQVDISDLSRLLDRLFISLAPLCCENQANVDGQPGIDIGDLTALIDYLYISFTPPAVCKW
jgi:Zn-dependent metalloprotease